jgi:ankyrin repeat protein
MRVASILFAAFLVALPVAAAEEKPTPDQLLLEASYRGKAGEVAELLSRGVDPDARYENGVTALITASWQGDATGRNGCSALSWAARNGYDQLVDLLLRHGANPNHADIGGFTPLTRAAWNGQTSVVRKLLAAGANPNNRDVFSNTPIVYAKYYGFDDIVALLTASGAVWSGKLGQNFDPALPRSIRCVDPPPANKT